MLTDTTLAAGFAEPVLQSQAAYRALLTALSEPGLPQTLAAGFAAPEGLDPAAAIVLLTLADHETPVWLPPALRDGPAGRWLRFHCGAPLVTSPNEAAFAVLSGAAEAPSLAEFHQGDDQFPDRSTTVIVSCAALEGGEAVRLSGPGIPVERSIAPAGLRADFWAQIEANAALYPLGVDIVLSCSAAILGLPRSTQIRRV